MDKLLKQALENDVVGFINRFKDKMSAHKEDIMADITRQTAADMAGVEVQEAKKDPMHVFVSTSGKGITWRTSDQRTGSEPSFSDPKDEKALRAYFQKVFGKKKEFTLEIREAADVAKLDDDKLISWIKKNDTDEPGISPVFGKQIKSAKAEAKKRGLKI